MEDMKKLGCLGCLIGLIYTPFAVIFNLARQYSGSRRR